MCRYAKDLPTLMHIMAGPNAERLRLSEPLFTKDIKVNARVFHFRAQSTLIRSFRSQIYYKDESGFSLTDIPVQKEIKVAMNQAVKHFESNGLSVEAAPIGSMQKLIECGLAQFFQMQDVPLIVKDGAKHERGDNVMVEMLKSMFGKSKYSFAGLFFCFLYNTNGLIGKRSVPNYLETGQKMRQKLLVCNDHTEIRKENIHSNSNSSHFV